MSVYNYIGNTTQAAKTSYKTIQIIFKKCLPMVLLLKRYLKKSAQPNECQLISETLA